MELKLLIEEFIINYGLISIFIIVALEYANAPLPSEIVLPFVGILAFKFDMNIFLVILVSIIGGVFGSVLNYYLGYKLGQPLLSFIKNKYPKTKKSIKASYRWLAKYEKISVMLSRLVPLARTFISIVAGVTRMNVLQFTLYSAIGISVWNIVLILVGYFIGDNMDLIVNIMNKYSLVVGIIGILVIGFYWITLKNRKEKDSDKYINQEV
ncbi:DedA family protein [Romboutsia sp. 1001216sp1]|uniref:DedA family protein n=1 Tax=unclassified Romboutsia TaxID=2626894 RepID=UPI0018997FA9|nr:MULTISPECIES: DedA family protein [unclassified Romboutsia]MDB8789345.1 DedA family protein [Romboutsia sp. 1001216sp1]MDB8802081.1 DedA family protein [Romboutsia sp. 1001216sp1]MDB8813478.1 DedA family protein [Romboutsia sp. 1001216sp1]